MRLQDALTYSLNSFVNDPADTEFQRGYQAALEDLSRELVDVPRREFLVVTMADCKWCDRVKEHLTRCGHGVHEVDLADAVSIMTKFARHSVPQVFELIGNHDQTVKEIC